MEAKQFCSDLQCLVDTTPQPTKKTSLLIIGDCGMEAEEEGECDLNEKRQQDPM